MSTRPYRVLLVDYKDTDVSGEIPHLFKMAGCNVDVFCSKNSWLLKSRYRDSWQPADTSDLQKYIAQLSQLARTGNYDWIILLDDTSVCMVHDFADDVLAHKALALLPDAYRDLAGSKAALSLQCQQHNLPTPLFAIHDSTHDILQDASNVPFPLLLKVDRSGGGKGLHLCNNKIELRDNYAKIPPLQHNNLLIQKYIVGENISVETLYRDGQLITYAAARVIQNVRNEFDISCVRKYEPFAEILPLVRRMGAALKLNGFCSITLMHDIQTDMYYIVEADLRTHSWFALSRFAGVHFSQGITKYLAGDTTLLPTTTTTIEVRHFARDVVRSLRNHDWKNIWNWVRNKDGRWRFIPLHDLHLFAVTTKQIGRTWFYDQIPRWPLVHALGKIYRYFSGEKKRIALSIFLSFVQAGTLIPLPIITRYTLDNVLPQKNASLLFWSLGAGVVLLLCSTLLMLLHRFVTLAASKSIITQLRRQLITRALSLHFSFFGTEDLERMHSRIVQDTERLDRVTNAILAQTLPALLISVGISGVLLYLNPLLFSIIIICLPIGYLMGRFMGKRLRASIRDFHTDFTAFSSGVSFVLKFNELIMLSTAQQKEQQQQEAKIQALEFSSKRMAWLSAVYNAIQNNIVVCCGSIVFLVGGLQMLHGTTTIGSVLSFYAALTLLLSNARTVISSVPTLIEGAESYKQLLPLLEQERSSKTITATTKPFDFPITFQDVSFTYGTAFTLHDISFTITQGSVTGIFGPSGSGKTTLIRLLLGLYAPTQGTITVNSTSLCEIDTTLYRRAIGILSQDPALFPGTIRENLVYGLEDVPHEKIVEVCTLCHIHKTITELPYGYDTPIGHRGITLSGGQKQRIAIARALLRKPRLLILDEPDNNLDDALIKEIITAVQSIGQTMIIISHNAVLQSMVDTKLTIADGHVTCLHKRTA